MQNGDTMVLKILLRKYNAFWNNYYHNTFGPVTIFLGMLVIAYFGGAFTMVIPFLFVFKYNIIPWQ